MLTDHLYHRGGSGCPEAQREVEANCEDLERDCWGGVGGMFLDTEKAIFDIRFADVHSNHFALLDGLQVIVVYG